MHNNNIEQGFIIRVYGILLDDEKGVLVSDEKDYGMQFTKFPGGGLNFGEGLKDCLIREWKEELNQEIEIVQHFYTTDFFQLSAFHSNQQLISVYYLVNALTRFLAQVSNVPFDFDGKQEPQQSFRWIEKHEFSETQFTFPVDQHVAGMISKKILSLK